MRLVWSQRMRGAPTRRRLITAVIISETVGKALLVIVAAEFTRVFYPQSWASSFVDSN
jgi:hypothetical protein